MYSGHILVSEVSVSVNEAPKCGDKASFSGRYASCADARASAVPAVNDSAILACDDSGDISSSFPSPRRLMWRVAANYAQNLLMDLRRYAVLSSGAHPR